MPLESPLKAIMGGGGGMYKVLKEKMVMQKL
jgi:hypothetical protein